MGPMYNYLLLEIKSNVQIYTENPPQNPTLWGGERVGINFLKDQFTKIPFC